ncbi:MAG: GlxA family transcriptional regulator [Paracoccaceae bacterium]
MVRFEILVAKGYCDHEVSGITHTLAQANTVLRQALFQTRFLSYFPGLVASRGGQIARAEPVIDGHGFSDVMIVVGGTGLDLADWMVRVRQMQRQARRVVLLSDAATRYIKTKKSGSGLVTTHWKQADMLRETGYFPDLTDRLAEHSGGVITAAGSAATPELVAGLISPYLDQVALAELAGLLLLPNLRKSDADQPRDIAGHAGLFNQRVRDVIQVMEDNIAERLDMETLAGQVGMSCRQIERIFRDVFNQSPGKFYKHLRTKKAWALIEQTLLPLPEIAVATGFGSVSTMSKSVQAAYGVTPAQSRSRKSVDLMTFKA